MPELKITDIKTYIVSQTEPSEGQWSGTKPFLFVKLETNKGIDGWGEAYTLADRVLSTQMHIEEMKRYLIGYDPSRIKYFQYWTYSLFGERRPGIDLFCAMSGIEIAMWDIMGKFFHTPIYNLLGGPVHEKLKAYVNLGARGYKTPQEEVEKIREMVKFGFHAVKLYPFSYGEEEDQIVERIAKIREGVGNGVDLMIDVWRDADAKRVLSVAQRIEPYRIIWYEEPIAPDNLDVMADMRQKTKLPLVAGECIFGKRGFNEVFKKNAADILNPDVSVVGGILEMKEIAAMAEANYVQVGPHNCNSSTVSASASVHVACTMPNFNMLETFPWYWAIGDKICKNQLRVVDGYIRIPEGPGLGLEMNEDFLAAQVYQERHKNTWKYRK